MSSPTHVVPRESRLAPAHECPWCRSLEVCVVVALPEGDDRGSASGRCTTCGREVALVPAGFAC